MWKKSSFALALVFTTALTAGTPQRFEAAEPHMGTLFRIIVYASDRDSAQTAFHAAFARVAELDEALSDYKSDSELMRLCRDAYATPVALSSDLFIVLQKAQQLSRETSGAFDVTLGPVIQLWREARKSGTLPSLEALTRARQSTGYRHLILNAANHTALLDLPAMRLDLGAIGKGYAAAEALRVLQERGIASALVVASGDLAIGAPPPGKPGWQVAVELPGSAGQTLTLYDTAVSTSGDTEQYIEIGGTRYSHIIDSQTGNALTNRVAATVIAPNATDADSYATALCVLTAQHGAAFAIAWAERHAGVTARIAFSPQP